MGWNSERRFFRRGNFEGCRFKEVGGFRGVLEGGILDWENSLRKGLVVRGLVVGGVVRW